MPFLLFKLNNVPLDEADEVRELLSEQEVPFYETSQGFWGFSLGGLWLADSQIEEKERAEQLLEQFHQRREITAREEYQPLSFFAAILEKPLRLVLLLAVLVVLYISISPFVRPLIF